VTQDRVNDLRGLLRAHKLETPDDTALRDAIARQDAAMRANQEPLSAFREELDLMDSGPGIAATAAPVALGLGAFAAIVLTDGTEDLSWIRFTIAAVVFIAVAVGGAYAIGRWRLATLNRRLTEQDAAHRRATAAGFRADVERITGRPFPTDRATEK
jgi:hypothetical protein